MYSNSFLRKGVSLILSIILILSFYSTVSATVVEEDVTEPTEYTTEILNDEMTTEDVIGEVQPATYSVKYNAHVQKNGWMDTVSDGAVAGTFGESKRVEALQIWVEKTTVNESGNPITEKIQGAISYKAHVQSYGWMDAVSDGTVVGTSGQAKRMEAIQIWLTGDMANEYDVYYSTHVQSYGWLGWAKNGESAGSTGYGKRMEALKICLVKKGNEAPGNTDGHYISLTEKGFVTYSAHVQSYGWMESVADGMAAGTTGKSKRMEALKIWLQNPTDAYGNKLSGNIEYSGHVQGIGWQPYTSNGNITGTVGQGKRLEAIKIRLTGDMANEYDVYYRVHCATYGDLSWAKNGEIAGSEGCSKAIESIQIKVVKKGDANAPITNGRTYVSDSFIGSLSAQGYVQNIGWQTAVGSGQTIGTTGKSLRLEAMRMSIDTSGNYYDGSIYYSMYQQNTGWQADSANGVMAGTIEQGIRAEAVRIGLTGELDQYCDVWYRAQVESWGWLGWAKNGQEAGTKGIRARLEAVQIVITPKGAKAPGSNSDYLKTTKKSVGDTALYSTIANRSSDTNYIIAVDTQRCMVGIYAGTQGRWSQVKQFVCAPGKPSSPTVKGEFKVLSRGTSFGTSTYTCWYYTQFHGDYLFHSILYRPGSQTVVSESGLGTMASHGCVRLSLGDAKWIYDNIPNGTKVYVY